MARSVLKVLQQMKLSPKELLQPDSTLEFHEENHRYYDIKTKHWVSKSITDITKKSEYLSNLLKRDDDDPQKKKIQESIKRGVTVHSAIEHWFKTGEIKDTGDYRSWVNGFVNYPNLQGWNCIASEHRMIDRRYDVAGTLDFILENKEGRLALCDLKTKGEKFSKNHMEVKTQLGGYLNLIHHNHPTIHIDTCRVYWLQPNECSTDEYSCLDCLDLFQAARRVYHQKQPNF